MRKLPWVKLPWLEAGLLISGILGIPWLENNQFFLKWGHFVVHMPLLAGLILPVILYVCFLLYQNGLIPISHPPENRVLLIRNNTILSDGLISLLMKQPNLILSTINAVNQELLLERMDGFQPNTVILPDQHSHTTFVQILDLLDQYPSLRVIIRVGIENDQVQVFEKNQVSIQHLNDFASVINGSGKQYLPGSKTNEEIIRKSTWREDVLRRE